MADWKSLQIEVPGKELLGKARSALEGLLLLLDVLKAILDTIKVFLIDFGNPIRALVEALILLIQEVLLSLKVTGVYALFHVPNPIEDPSFNNHKGFDAFTEVFKQSLFDPKDSNRPQPRPGSTQGGFVLMTVTADAPYTLLGKIKQLLRFFYRDFISPRYEAPQNFKAAPLGPDGDPILSVLDVFTTNPDMIGLTWDLPTSSETPDPGFNDVISRVANEFVPANFLIEKSKGIDPASGLIDILYILKPDEAGMVEQAVTKYVAGTFTKVNQRALLRDIYNDHVIKFTECIVLDNTAVESLIGQLGRMHYIDKDVKPDVTYYYRVRAFTGDLDVSDNRQINFGSPRIEGGRSEPTVAWPSKHKDPEAVCVVGKPTGIVAVRLPPLRTGEAAAFDVILNLRRVFLAAFTCDFHRDVETPPNPIGQGSMVKMAGPVASFYAEDLIKEIQRQDADGMTAKILSFTTFASLECPWENRGIRRQSARLADAVGSAFLEAGGNALETFRELMQRQTPVLSEPNLEQALAVLTSVELDDFDRGSNFVTAYTGDDVFREQLLGVVTFLKNFTGGGISPDWISVSPLRDIVPWSGEIIYALLDKIQALVDAFNGVLTELNDFISLLSRKIDTLERLLEQLLSVLDFIESLQIGAYVLVVPAIDGSAHDWAQAVDNAQGTVPPRGPGGYSAGVAISYVAPDVTGLAAAFSLIFGL